MTTGQAVQPLPAEHLEFLGKPLSHGMLKVQTTRDIRAVKQHPAARIPCFVCAMLVQQAYGSLERVVHALKPLTNDAGRRSRSDAPKVTGVPKFSWEPRIE